jgi:Cys-tRNA synthase (O-phospho-L-seryl-tRNA:Cys-tRNA synthase)
MSEMGTVNICPMGESKIIGNQLVEISFAQEFQEAILSSSVLEFEKEELKNKILEADKKQLIVVTSTINSPKVVNRVEFYGEEFLMNAL